MQKQEVRSERTIGSMWADQMEIWNSYANLYREQSEKLLNMWMGQVFDCQREGQKVIADWMNSAGRTSTDFCRAWEGQVKSAASGVSRGLQESGARQERSGEA